MHCTQDDALKKRKKINHKYHIHGLDFPEYNVYR
jgi:hypothetical protein